VSRRRGQVVGGEDGEGGDLAQALLVRFSSPSGRPRTFSCRLPVTRRLPWGGAAQTIPGGTSRQPHEGRSKVGERFEDIKGKAKEKLDELTEQGQERLEEAKAAGKERFEQAKEKAEEMADRFKEESS